MSLYDKKELIIPQDYLDLFIYNEKNFKYQYKNPSETDIKK